MQLMILGMHRSGTSVLARLINLMGVYFGAEGVSTGANKENPKGFWERQDVRELNDMVLHSAGCDWNRVAGFDLAAVPTPVITEFKQRAAKLVLEMDAHRPWFLKEPRLCLLFSLWRPLVEAPLCIHILRHPVEVAASLRTRNEIPIDAGLALWERYVKAALHQSSDLPSLMVSHRELMEDPRSATRKLIAELQAAEVPNLRTPTDREIDSFVTAELYREREGRPELAKWANAPQVKDFEKLLQEPQHSFRNLEQLSVNAKKTLVRYESRLPPLEVPKRPKPPMSESERLLREQLALKTQEIEFTRELADKASAESSSREERLLTLQQELFSVREVSAKQLAVKDAELLSVKEASREASHKLRIDIQERDKKVRLLERERDALYKVSADLKNSLEDNANLRRSVEELAATQKVADDARALAEKSVSERFKETEALTRLVMDQEKATRSAELRAQGLEKKLAGTTAALQERTDSAARTSTVMTKLQREYNTLKASMAREAYERTVAAAKANAEITRLSREREALRRQLGQLTLLSANQEALAEDLSQRLAAIKSSLGWRMIAPVRSLRRMFTKDSGKPEAQDGDAGVIQKSELFDVDWYLERNQDVAESGMDPVEHYLQYGAYEGRNPGPGFDTSYYLSRYPDVAKCGLNPLVHYIRYGNQEGRRVGSKDGDNE